MADSPNSSGPFLGPRGLSDTNKSLVEIAGRLGGVIGLAEKLAGLITKPFENAAKAAVAMEEITARQAETTLRLIASHQTEAQQLQALQKVQDSAYRRLAELKKHEGRTETRWAEGGEGQSPVSWEAKVGLSANEKAEQANLGGEVTERGSELDRLALSVKAKADAEKEKQAAMARAAAQERAAGERAAAEQKKIAEDQAKAQLAAAEALHKKKDEDDKAARDKEDAEEIARITKSQGLFFTSVDEEIARNDRDPNLTDLEKFQARVRLLEQETDALKAATVALKQYKAEHPDLAPANVATIDASIKGYADKDKKVSIDRQPPQTKGQKDAIAYESGSDPTKHYQSAGAGALGSLRQQVVKIGTLGDEIAGVFTTVGDTIRKSLGSAFADAILKGGTFRKTMTNIGQAIVTSFVQSGAQMVADLIWQHTVMAGIKKWFTAQDVATHGAGEVAKVALTTGGEVAQTAAVATGSGSRGLIKVGETIFHGIQVGIRTAVSIVGEIAQTAITIAQAPLRIASMLAESGVKLVSAALGAMAAMSSIPYVGPFLAIAAMAGIIAAGSKLLHREQGGPVSSGQAYIVGEKRPEVFVPDTDGFIIPSVAQAMTRPGYAPSTGSGGSGGGRAGGGAGNRNMSIALIDSRDRAGRERIERNPHNEAYVVEIMQRNRRQFGVKA